MNERGFWCKMLKVASKEKNPQHYFTAGVTGNP